MPRQKDERPRVLGPIWLPSREAWQVTTLDPGRDGRAARKRRRFFRDEEEAKQFAVGMGAKLSQLEGRTVAQALVVHEEYLVKRGWEDKSREERMRRLRAFFEDVLETQIARLHRERCDALYEAYQVARSVTTHRDTLGNARGFLNWCIRQGWLGQNPLAGVEGVGRRNRGKQQLTGDEAQRLYRLCLRRARQGDEAALGVLMLLLMGLRQSDVIERRVRDVDLNGTVLRIEKAKTKKSERPRNIPVVLRPLLREVIEDRDPTEPLFAPQRTNAWMLQALSKRLCPAAGVPYVCPHALKGTAGSLLAVTGELADRIADHLSHEKSSTTLRHYIAPGTLEDAQIDRAAAIISSHESSHLGEGAEPGEKEGPFSN